MKEDANVIRLVNEVLSKAVGGGLRAQDLEDVLLAQSDFADAIRLRVECEPHATRKLYERCDVILHVAELGESGSPREALESMNAYEERRAAAREEAERGHAQASALFVSSLTRLARAAALLDSHQTAHDLERVTQEVQKEVKSQGTSATALAILLDAHVVAAQEGVTNRWPKLCAQRMELGCLRDDGEQKDILAWLDYTAANRLVRYCNGRISNPKMLNRTRDVAWIMRRVLELGNLEVEVIPLQDVLDSFNHHSIALNSDSIRDTVLHLNSEVVESVARLEKFSHGDQEFPSFANKEAMQNAAMDAWACVMSAKDRFDDELYQAVLGFAEQSE